MLLVFIINKDFRDNSYLFIYFFNLFEQGNCLIIIFWEAPWGSILKTMLTSVWRVWYPFWGYASNIPMFDWFSNED